MNDIVETDQAPSKHGAALKAGGKVAGLIPANFDDAFRIARALSSAGDMVPEHFRGNTEKTFAAIASGMEIGMAPMQALTSFAVINGRATLWGDAIPALLQRNGHHIDVEVTGEGMDAVATATLERGDTGRTYVRTFSMKDAEKAGLLSKKGNIWKQYPMRMISHRARTWAARDGAADALKGMQIAEEVQDYQPMRDVTPDKPKAGGFAEMVTQARDDKPKQIEATQAEPAVEQEKTSEMSDEEAGALAFDEGKTIGDCPYDDTEASFSHWIEGYNNAVNEYEAENKPDTAENDDQANTAQETDQPASDSEKTAIPDDIEPHKPSANELGGQIAFMEGQDIGECPFEPDTEEGADWLFGWRAKRNEAKQDD